MKQPIDRLEYIREKTLREMLAAVDCLRADVQSGAIRFITVVCEGPQINYAVRVLGGDPDRRGEQLLAAARSVELTADSLLDLD